jgi:hypothetical protein
VQHNHPYPPTTADQLCLVHVGCIIPRTARKSLDPRKHTATYTSTKLLPVYSLSHRGRRALSLGIY